MSYGSAFGTSSIDNSLAADAQSLGQLKLQAGNSSPGAIKETAKQFESMFMKELLKSMRDANASMKTGMMDNAGSDLGTDLLDQQFAVKMSGQPGGLSAVIEAQLNRQMGLAAAAKGATQPSSTAPATTAPPATRYTMWATRRTAARPPAPARWTLSTSCRTLRPRPSKPAAFQPAS